jgi:hypothetical protein
VNELRQRTGTLLAAAALSASFFGAVVLGHRGVSLPVVLAGASLTVTVLSSLYVLYPHDLDFAIDARGMYRAFGRDRDDPERLHLRLAFGLRDTRERNGGQVERLGRCLSVAVLALVVQLACWTWAAAVL